MKAKHFILILFITIFVGCNSTEVDNDKQQIIDIVEYLEGLEVQYEEINGVYRINRLEALYIPEEADTTTTDGSDIVDGADTKSDVVPEDDTTEEVVLTLSVGDSIYINYAAYIFNSRPSTFFDTNVINIAEAAGFNADDKNLVPFGIKYGETQLLTGLHNGLENLKTGDKVSIFMPYSLAFGVKEIGIIPSESAITYDIDVIKIVRQ